MSIFDHTDDDGDRIMITEADSGHWIVGIIGHQGDIAQMILDDEAIGRLVLAAFHADWGQPRILDAGTEITDDGRRIDAIKAAREVIPSLSSADRLVAIAEWIMGAPWEKQVQK